LKGNLALGWHESGAVLEPESCQPGLDILSYPTRAILIRNFPNMSRIEEHFRALLTYNQQNPLIPHVKGNNTHKKEFHSVSLFDTPRDIEYHDVDVAEREKEFLHHSQRHSLPLIFDDGVLSIYVQYTHNKNSI
jgi:hypothetical protein